MIPEIIGSWLTSITSMGWDKLLSIAGTIGFVNAFLSLAITQSFSRRAFIRWRLHLLVCLCLLWIAVVFILVDVYAIIINPEHIFYFSTLGMIFWITGVFLLLWILFKIFLIDQLCFTITCCACDFEKFETHFWKKEGDNTCIDTEIIGINNNPKPGEKKDSTKYPYYPIILEADESWRPWEIAGDFAVNALHDGAGVIWFGFARPPQENSVLIRKIKERYPDDLVKFKEKIIHIDCFDPGKNLNKNANKNLPCILCKTFSGCGSICERIQYGLNLSPMGNILFADPRNPDEIDRQYSKAVKHLRETLQCTKLCVVYDPVTDFLNFTDIEMASRYLRVAMAWEEQKYIHSLYIMRMGVLDPRLEQYIFWFANTVITLKTKDGNPTMVIRGLDKSPRTYKIDYDLTCCDKVLTGSPGLPGS
jgi:hypothetical protein